jgi:membrane complex biogenesis BtpA family protein
MSKTFLGVIHLLPLPSASGGRMGFPEVMSQALRDAEALAEGGVDGVIVENFGDSPYHKGTREDPVPSDVVAGLAVVADRVRREFGLRVGINCLRNDGLAALGAAAVVGAHWIRVNVLSGAMVTDQCVIEGEAARLGAYRNRMQLDVEILADFLVKHAHPLGPVDVASQALDLAERSGASGLILSGSRTGTAVDENLIDEVRRSVGGFPLWIGSGLDHGNAERLWPRCDGAIVGTALKRGGEVTGPDDPERVRRLRGALGG